MEGGNKVGFVDNAITRCEETWKRVLEHPFVCGIADGTLSQERFRHYLQQDFVFLVAYCRVLALAVAHSEDLEKMGRFAGLLQATLGEEMSLHRQVCAEYRIDTVTLEKTVPSPTCVAYTNHLLSAAKSGELALLCAALLPCAVGYARIGMRLAESGVHPPVKAYRDWIASYASEPFQAWAEWLTNLTGHLAATGDEGLRVRMHALFARSVDLEIRFWEMAWNLEGA
jgi:thiaminase/transcriptional activator TenA